MAKQTRSIDLNSATAEEITSANIDQVSEEKANSLIEFRDENGPFESWEDVKRVPGFNDRMIENLRQGGASIGEEADTGESSEE
jgi:competence protein ComEA